MATIVVEKGPSEERTVFTGSSKEDMAYAKTFWQSVQLLPPMESRLVSSDIKQRLKRAPPGGQCKSQAYFYEDCYCQCFEVFIIILTEYPQSY